MRGAFFTLILCVVFFHGVTSSPTLKGIVGDGPPENIAAIRGSTVIANDKIKNMQAVLNGPNPKAHPAVVKSFGTNANIAEIKKNVGALETGRYRVPDSSADPRVTQGGMNVETKAVSFGAPFFKSTPEEQAGTIIHEAGHVLYNAVDYFDHDGNPIPQETKIADKTKVLVGYKDSNLDKLKEIASHNMHHNADSYRVFAEECPQARELFRRALEERDPVAQAHLMRRGVAACAYRPKGASKAKAPGSKAAKAASKKPIRAMPVAKKAGSRRPVRARPVAKKAGSRQPVRARPVAKKTGSGTPARTRPVSKKAGSSTPARARPIAQKAGSRKPVQARLVTNSKVVGKAAPKKAGRK